MQRFCFCISLVVIFCRLHFAAQHFDYASEWQRTQFPFQFQNEKKTEKKQKHEQNHRTKTDCDLRNDYENVHI